ncbi:general secretion pathway protein GspD [Pseudidiomarina salinarum]|uniref:General secretion pathway protein GspD n=1 Tax=Pseudidiomarina salinarum TaxID=435908 RepID=A0A094IUK1_9GAMM|nr:type II secretion system secretin GspD [Pseudidiomarina salinarum]KFZ31335.1 general secretion pathway protein GspD [Pseudidiomarina salinarum]RUO70913.1 type II secretion system protein GspD [Pseudidiomarina salinarum]
MRTIFLTTTVAMSLALILGTAGTVGIAEAAPQQQSPPQGTGPVEYTASFKNTDISEFIQVVGRNLGKTMIIDPDVRGRIDVRSYDVMTESQYWQFFLNVLDVYGFATVTMESGVVKVMRDKDARNGALPVVDDNSLAGDTLVTRVVPVANVSVRELAPLLRLLNDQAGGGNVVSYDPSNVIMLTGRSETIQRLVEIIERVDRAGNQDVDIVNLEYASASEVVRIAMTLYEKSTDGTPALLIPKVVADERTNRVIISGDPRARERVVKLIKQLDKDLKTQGNTRVYYLKYAKAENLVGVLTGVSDTVAAESGVATGAAGAGQRRSGKEISITAHESSNSLVITAQPDMLANLENVIRQLDIRRAQVHVEAIIVELMEGDGIDLGLQWISEDGGMVQYNNGRQVPIGQLAAGAYMAQERERGTTTTIVDGNVVTTEQPPERGNVDLLAQLLGNVNGMMIGVVKNDWGAILQAVSTNTNSNILATPSIMTLDNESAEFLVGQSVPTITGSTAGDNNSNPFQTVQREDIGIKLKVTPQINEGNAVQLIIEQEVSSLSGATSVDITINKRQLKTVVMADDGETIVLGGLIDEDVQESVSKVPLLGDIPVLGHLFRSTSTSRQKRNLMVFLKPTIVRDRATALGMSSRKYNYIRAEQLLRQEEGVELMPRTSTPVLPEWDGPLTLPPEFEKYMDDNSKQEMNEGSGND